MIKIHLKDIIRCALYLILFFICLCIETSSFFAQTKEFFTPFLWLPFFVFWSVEKNFYEALCLIFLSCFVLSSFSSIPISWIFLIHMMCVFFIRKIHLFFELNKKFFYGILSCIYVFLFHLSLYFYLSINFNLFELKQSFTPLITGSIFIFFFSFFLINLFDQIEKLTKIN